MGQIRKKIRQEVVKCLVGNSGEFLRPLSCVPRIYTNREEQIDDETELPICIVYTRDDDVDDSKSELYWVRKQPVDIVIYDKARVIPSGQKHEVDQWLSEPSDQLDDLAQEVMNCLRLNESYLRSSTCSSMEFMGISQTLSANGQRNHSAIAMRYAFTYRDDRAFSDQDCEDVLTEFNDLNICISNDCENEDLDSCDNSIKISLTEE